MTLRVIIVLACMLFIVAVSRQIAAKRLLLRYSLLWFALAFCSIVAAIFPEPLFALANLVGFETPSNFIFFFALFFLLVISLSLSVVVSRQSVKIKRLVQHCALLDKRIEEMADDGIKKTTKVEGR